MVLGALCCFPAKADSPPQALDNISTIFVSPLGSSEVAQKTRTAIVDRLSKSGKVRIAKSPEEADSSLVGIAIGTSDLLWAKYGSEGRKHKWITGEMPGLGVAVRLIGKSHQVLWQGEATDRLLGQWSVVSDVAGQICGKLIDAIRKGGDPPRLTAQLTGTGSGNPARRLSAVRTVFVAPLGDDDGAELVRTKLIGRLLEAGSYSVVDSADGANATLDGVASVGVELVGGNAGYWEPQTNSWVSPQPEKPSYTVHTRVQVLGESSQELLEIDAQRRDLRMWKATSSVANELARKFVQAVARDKTQ